jgi:chromosome segregation ATPase
MNDVVSRRSGTRGSPTPRRRADVEALMALASLDQGVARREAKVASALAVVERARADSLSCEREIGTARDELRRIEQGGAAAPGIEKLRRRLREKERSLVQLTRLAEEAQAEAIAASADLKERFADLPDRRDAITSRIPRATLEDYEDALRHGLLPAAMATRGRVCWGCFHPLSATLTAEFTSAEAFLRCPHCERVLFNPDWIERP